MRACLVCLICLQTFGVDDLKRAGYFDYCRESGAIALMFHASVFLLSVYMCPLHPWLARRKCTRYDSIMPIQNMLEITAIRQSVHIKNFFIEFTTAYCNSHK